MDESSDEDKAREICVRACECFLERVLLENPDALGSANELGLEEEQRKEMRVKKRSHLIQSVARLWSLNEMGMEFYFSSDDMNALIHALVHNDASAIIASGQKRLQRFYAMAVETASVLIQDHSFATRVRLAALRIGEKN